MACAFVYAHAAVAFEFVYAHAVVAFEFVYAHAHVTVVAQAARSLLGSACARAKSAWQWLEERSPASVKRAVSHRFTPAVVLAVLMVLPAAYWAMPRGGSGDGEQHRLSVEDWQVSFTPVHDRCRSCMLLML